MHRVSVGGVVLNKDGEVLVVSQHGTSWSLPKGGMEDGEDELSTARREIYEESGIVNLEMVRKLGTYERFKIGFEAEEDPSVHMTIHIYLFRTSEMDLRPVDPENPEARWVKKEGVADLLTHKKDKEFFRSVQDQI